MIPLLNSCGFLLDDRRHVAVSAVKRQLARASPTPPERPFARDQSRARAAARICLQTRVSCSSGRPATAPHRPEGGFRLVCQSAASEGGENNGAIIRTENLCDS